MPGLLGTKPLPRNLPRNLTQLLEQKRDVDAVDQVQSFGCWGGDCFGEFVRWVAAFKTSFTDIEKKTMVTKMVGIPRALCKAANIQNPSNCADVTLQTLRWKKTGIFGSSGVPRSFFFSEGTGGWESSETQ